MLLFGFARELFETFFPPRRQHDAVSRLCEQRDSRRADAGRRAGDEDDGTKWRTLWVHKAPPASFALPVRQ
jgi:hypothetical protein